MPYYVCIFRFFSATNQWLIQETDIVQHSDLHAHIDDGENFMWIDPMSGRLYVLDSWATPNGIIRHYDQGPQFTYPNCDFISSFLFNHEPIFLVLQLGEENSYRFYEVGDMLNFTWLPNFDFQGQQLYLVQGRSGFVFPCLENETEALNSCRSRNGIHSELITFQGGQAEDRLLCPRAVCMCRCLWLLMPKDMARARGSSEEVEYDGEEDIDLDEESGVDMEEEDEGMGQDAEDESSVASNEMLQDDLTHQLAMIITHTENLKKQGTNGVPAHIISEFAYSHNELPGQPKVYICIAYP